MDWTQFWNAGGFLIGVGGGIIGLLGILFTRKSIRREFKYSVLSVPVIADYKSNMDELSVLYKGKEVERLTVSRVAFWNDGWGSIGQEDISKILPITLTIKEPGTILNVKEVYSSSKANGVTIIKNNENDSYRISFDNLDSRMGSVLQVIHTGTSSKEIKLSGKIRGVKSITKTTMGPNRLALMSLIAGFVFYIGGWLGSLANEITKSSEMMNIYLIMIVGGLILTVSVFISVKVYLSTISGIRKYLNDLPIQEK